MRILVACECSGTVREAFAARGHEAWSCDLQPSKIPGNHYEGDCFELLARDIRWDMIIAHPPCTYLSKAGVPHLLGKRQNAGFNLQRYYQGLQAASFFRRFMALPVPKIAIENPTPLKMFGLPAPDDVIEPYYFGDPFKKRTCLWLKGLPPLVNSVECVHPESTLTSRWYNNGGKDRQSRRSVTFPGVAAAMASQWSEVVNV